MAKAKRERRTSIRTMESGNGASDLLDRMAQLESAEKARAQPLAGPEPEAPTDDEEGEGAGGEF